MASQASLGQQWRRTTVFRHLEKDPVVAAFLAMLGAGEAAAAADFARALYEAGTCDWAGYVERLVLCDVNCMTELAAGGRPVPGPMREAAAFDLALLGRLAGVGPEDVAEGPVPCAWEARPLPELGERYFHVLDHLELHGFGDFARHRAFRVESRDERPVLCPVPAPDPVDFAHLYGYEAQHRLVVANTRALLAGLPAANALLYGDAGTGKSATVKATANLLAPEGLRLVELTRRQLHLLPALLDQLSHNPLRFVVFIDDLSFQDSDEDFSALKAVLEGGVSTRAANTVIYATSNRRHLVRETFSAREGDDVHRQDTMQEMLSLAERFGLKVRYDRPGKAAYLAIVRGLAAEHGLELEAAQLDALAERFALRAGGRSARAARQLVDQLQWDPATG